MEYVLPNILAAAEFDRTAKHILSGGFLKYFNRFKARIVFKENGCFELLAKPNKDGYSYFRIGVGDNGVMSLSHRASWLFSGMKITKGLVLDHKCRNRMCINPHHLREVSRRTNTLENSNSPSAKNKIKNKCKNGHEFTKENTYNCKKNGLNGRSCRFCAILESKNKYWYKKMNAMGELCLL